MVKNLPAKQEMQKTWIQSLGPEDPLEEEMGNPLQYSCLENPMDRGAWWAAVHGVTKSRTRLSDFHFILTVSLSWDCLLSSAPKPHMAHGHLRGHRFRSYYFCWVLWAPDMLGRRR